MWKRALPPAQVNQVGEEFLHPKKPCPKARKGTTTMRECEGTLRDLFLAVQEEVNLQTPHSTDLLWSETKALDFYSGEEDSSSSMIRLQ